jgi:hypothetical protein
VPGNGARPRGFVDQGEAHSRVGEAATIERSRI